MRTIPASEAVGGDVVEVMLTSGEATAAACVLATKYLRPGDSFAVGEAEGCDAVVPHEVLAGDRRADSCRLRTTRGGRWCSLPTARTSG